MGTSIISISKPKLNSRHEKRNLHLEMRPHVETTPAQQHWPGRHQSRSRSSTKRNQPDFDFVVPSPGQMKHELNTARDAFIPESAPFTSDQRAWLNGFVAGLFAGLAQTGPKPSHFFRVYCIYGEAAR